jgi:hypothetical protein
MPRKMRGTNYNMDELLILSRSVSVMQVGEDPIVGSDQKFWDRVKIQHDSNIQKANQIHQNQPTYECLPTDRTVDSLKNQWYQKLQPTMQKLDAICNSNPPASGELVDDATMNMYYQPMFKIWKAQLAHLNKDRKRSQLPKKFEPYLRIYLYLKKHPKFAMVLEPGTVVRKRGAHSQRPGSDITGIVRPAGRDKSKKQRNADTLVDKVTEKICAATSTSEGTVSGEFLKELAEKMDVANECMADVANAQLMAMACTPERKQYFQARTTAIALAEANKLKNLELQKLELYI